MSGIDLEELNEAQARAVGFSGGPLLIVAGAGTGKTHTLTRRVAALIDRGTDPSRILLVTFSRRAASEMTHRVGHLVGAETAARLRAGTFHAVANHLLRRHASALGMPRSFTVMDQADSAELMGSVRADIVESPSGAFPARTPWSPSTREWSTWPSHSPGC